MCETIAAMGTVADFASWLIGFRLGEILLKILLGDRFMEEQLQRWRKSVFAELNKT